MCGICASIGKNNEIETVILGLKKLEYRGYDSSGVAYIKNEKNENEKSKKREKSGNFDKICVCKSVGQIKNLERKIGKIDAKIAIGHTRWATHGKVSKENAHPHLSHSGEFAIVHNGIIENFEDLKRNFDFPLSSETDTEVLVNLIETQDGASLERLKKACDLAKGSFALAMLHSGEQKIYLAKRSSPLMVAFSECGAVAASDISVFAGKFENCYILDDNEFAIMGKNSVEIFDANLKKVQKKPVFIKDFDFFEENLQEKTFMLKEIKEQPIVLRKTYFKYFAETQNLDFNALQKFKSFHFVACGTAYHSCLLGARFLKEFCHKDAKVSIASEFRYDKQIFSKNCLYVFVSQSGETADTIACAKLVKDKGLLAMCVTNVPYCSLNKLADFILPTFAGKEIAVASTKAYTAQVFTLLIFALKLAAIDKQEILKDFVLNYQISADFCAFFDEIAKFKKIFFIGRQQDYVTALEGALKLKEIAYLPCIGIAAGELKHGTLALVDDETLVVAISTQKELKEKMESNILEVKARGGKILLVSQFEHNVDAEFCIKLGDFAEFLMPIVSIVPLQQLALAVGEKLGHNPDIPRNLAKSVTVE